MLISDSGRADHAIEGRYPVRLLSDNTDASPAGDTLSDMFALLKSYNFHYIRRRRLDKLEQISDPLWKPNQGGPNDPSESVHETDSRNTTFEIGTCLTLDAEKYGLSGIVLVSATMLGHNEYCHNMDGLQEETYSM